MIAPQNLSRPLAARVTSLPDPANLLPGPELPQAVIDAALDALDAGKTKYTDRPGILPLRTWVADTLNDRYGLAISPDDVTITCGGTEARFVAIKKLVPAGTQLFCPGDSQHIAGPVALVGAEVASECITPTAISSVYLTPALSDATLPSALELVHTHGWWVIWDIDHTPRTGFHPAQDSGLAPRVVTLGSLSDRLPGWRMGWFAGSEQALQLRAFKQSMTICSPSISQWAALGLVESQ
jgi:aspartate/methionine/tyrosine aminotransferase